MKTDTGILEREKIRMLAAIMFTDIVGYTALMQQDERKAKRLRDKHRSVLERNISAHKGRILQFYGDGTLSIFPSAIDAVYCAIAIQQVLQNKPVIPLRIGIHVGDVVYEDDGIYGDGVNVASRIESLAIPGSVLVSERVAEEIRNHPVLPVTSLGQFELKNVQQAVEIFAVNAGGLPLPRPEDIRARTITSYKSIAVLPFVNMSSDPENEYFSDGITEELLNALARVEGLQVTARTSSFAFKGHNEDIRTIAARLNVSTVLEGSVRRAGNRVRITAQLINATDGFHLWSEVFEREMQDIFDLQDEIARNIANRMREKLSLKALNEKLVPTSTRNMNAYNLYLKGRYYQNKWTGESTTRALELFEAAMEEQPDFVQPVVNIAGCYVYLGMIGRMPADLCYRKARDYAGKALELGKSAEAYLALAAVALFFEWEWDRAEENFQKAFALSYNNNAEVYHFYSFLLNLHGKAEAAVVTMEKAQAIDPLSLPINKQLARTYHLAGRNSDALEQYRRTLDLEPGFRSGLWDMGWVHTHNGDYDKALETFYHARDLAGDELAGLAPIGAVYALMGRYAEARECIAKLHLREQREPNISFLIDFAVVYAALKEYDRVFEYLEQACAKRYFVPFVIFEPLWAAVVRDKRFAALMRKAGLGTWFEELHPRLQATGISGSDTGPPAPHTE